MARDADLDALRAQADMALRELEAEDDWDFEERTSPAVHVHFPRERMPSVTEEAEPAALAGLSPRARLIVAVVVAVLTALGARWGL